VPQPQQATRGAPGTPGGSPGAIAPA
jgi:hypothetical protein